MSIVMTDFAKRRLFPKDQRINAIVGETVEGFEQYLNNNPPEQIRAGYAPFCKLYVYRNWTQTRCLTVKITPENQSLLRSAYEARSKDELPVLVRWFEGIDSPRAEYLIVILYSREQLLRESTTIEADWGVVGCLANATADEIPMAPITMMRNALGVEEGGSGVTLDRQAYQRSVEYWSTHANWRAAK
ncbi:DUF3228 family protein [Sinimarinibacterium sp. NLF-5-8]|uniref:DUF3228 family protein n=1 Tax=Sinimarinibacterium sp. NLF-5-8 TaxID=2698684 RepID=UPI00137C225A|nr:DUF3228 family protein [Sinimarinibacterium sp. NLF-5-8]QHS09926.1 DUF3228 family protein [Sinimarinibacterium sp. NLF-5-8]